MTIHNNSTVDQYVLNDAGYIFLIKPSESLAVISPVSYGHYTDSAFVPTATIAASGTISVTETFQETPETNYQPIFWLGFCCVFAALAFNMTYRIVRGVAYSNTEL